MKKHLSDPHPGKPTYPIYWGCQTGRAGHYAWGPGLWVRLGLPHLHNRWLRNRDGLLPPPGSEQQGRCTLSHPLGDFTCLAFWDRSVDAREGSNSAFVLPGILNFELAAALAREAFPAVFARMNFELKLVDGVQREPGCARPG
jgi:hypothetical protein